MIDDPRRSALPDDIEQLLLDGRRLRATADLAERRGITFDEARVQIQRWLLDRWQSGPPKADNAPPPADC